MSIDSASASNILKKHGVDTEYTGANIDTLASQLRAILEDCIDETVMYEEVAAAIKHSVFVFVNSSHSATIVASALRPSIYNSVGLNGGYVDLVDIYNDGSELKKNPYFFDDSGGFYLREREGFRIHKAGHFLEKAAKKFMSLHPECTVRVYK